MIEEIKHLVSHRVSPERADLIEVCLFQFREDFRLENIDDVCLLIISQIDNEISLDEVDLLVTDVLINLYVSKLKIFGVTIDRGHLNRDCLRTLYNIASVLLSIEKHDDTDYLLAVAEDEELNSKEVIAKWVHHIYGTDELLVICILDNIHSSLIPRAAQALQEKLTKEDIVDESLVIPDYIKHRLGLFSGVYSGVFFDYVNSGGLIGVSFNATIEQVVHLLTPLKEKPDIFINEVLLFALASNMPNHKVIPTVQALIGVNFPLPEEAVIAKATIDRYLQQYGDTLNESS